jgi:hypothetical protein
VSLVQVQRRGDHEVRLAVSAKSLARLDQAQRVAGRACGFEFELNPDGQKALSLFEVRFREELARVPKVASSGGEAAKSTTAQAE